MRIGIALSMLCTFVLVAVVAWCRTAPAAKAFETTSSDLDAEVEDMIKLMELKADYTVCEVGGGNGTMLVALLSRAQYLNAYYGTGKDIPETDAMEHAAKDNKLYDSYVVDLRVGKDESSGLPAGKCDAIWLRMVYHMLPHPKAYLADFKKALKPDGRLLIMEHNPDNGKTEREGAILSMKMNGMVMKMAVVPQDAMVDEATDAGFVVVSGPFDWKYFDTPHSGYLKGSGRGYGLVLKRKPLCNCQCGRNQLQCGASCGDCDCEGCEPVLPVCNVACVRAPAHRAAAAHNLTAFFGFWRLLRTRVRLIAVRVCAFAGSKVPVRHLLLPMLPVQASRVERRGRIHTNHINRRSPGGAPRGWKAACVRLVEGAATR